ncbi:SDR family oxidoreductase [Oryzisolibacter sp. LB2S]|uniref:SDR family oxidoreductase n=1 Tax=Alicycliphilus soli TaxID=3228789 RepID=UPI003459A3AD
MRQPLPSAAAAPDSLTAAPPEPVVVITGASSGIGHATALAFAGRGARLVLAARNADTLAPVALACRAAGGQALGIPTDVTDADAVLALADKAQRHFGRIDIWVNAVGVGAVGRFDGVPLAAHRRVVEANLLGHLHGAHAALTRFRAQGSGLLVNLISLGGWLPTPYAAAYAASKFGLRGLSESLRAEVADLPRVHICDVAPTVVDTPGMSHGANYTGRRLRAPLPMVDPHAVAQAIVALADSPEPRAVTWLGLGALPGRLAHALAPQGTARALRWLSDQGLRRAAPAPVSEGNLFRPSLHTAIDGGHRRHMKGSAGLVALLGALGLAAGWWLGRRR